MQPPNLEDLAVAALRDILADPAAPPAVRARAAHTVLRQAAGPKPPQSAFARALHRQDQLQIETAPHEALRQL